MKNMTSFDKVKLVAQTNMEHAGNNVINDTSNNTVNNPRTKSNKRQKLDSDVVSGSSGLTIIYTGTNNI